jgi:hypothetical protein
MVFTPNMFQLVRWSIEAVSKCFISGILDGDGLTVFVVAKNNRRDKKFVKSEPEPHFKLMFTSYVHTSGKETNNFYVKQFFPRAQFFPFKFYLLTAAVLLSIRNDTTTAFPVCRRIDLTEHFCHF